MAANALEAAQSAAAFGPATGDHLTTQSGSAYELVSHLGSGAFGEVWRCTVLDGTGEHRAVKIVRTDSVSSVEDEVNRHARAVQMAGAVFVPQFYEFAQGMVGALSSPCYAIVMQLIDGKAVDGLSLPVNLKVREMVATVVMHDVLVALSRLHSAGIVHRDIKPANVLAEGSTGHCYLCDFGVSLFLEDVPPGQEMTQTGTPLYMAPEMMKTIPTKYDAKVDVWSLGVMGFELDKGRTPIQTSKDDFPDQEFIFSTLQTMMSPTFDSSFSLRYCRLVQACLEVVPESRPSAAELLDGMTPTVQATERKFLRRLIESA